MCPKRSSKVPLDSSWEPLGPLLGASWSTFGASWGLLGASWAPLGASWSPKSSQRPPKGLPKASQKLPKGLRKASQSSPKALPKHQKDPCELLLLLAIFWKACGDLFVPTRTLSVACPQVYWLRRHSADPYKKLESRCMLARARRRQAG